MNEDLIQATVQRLQLLGTLPAETENALDRLAEWQTVLNAVVRPINRAEAKLLCSLFGVDDSYGLAWSLLHTIESSDDLSDEDLQRFPRNEWIDLLISRRDRHNPNAT